MVSPGSCKFTPCTNAPAGFYYKNSITEGCDNGKTCHGLSDSKCDVVACDNAPSGNFYTSKASDGNVAAPGDCKFSGCTNAPVGYFYKDSKTEGCNGNKPCAGLDTSVCDVVKCDNAPAGNFYVSKAEDGTVTSPGNCKYTPCTTALPGEYYKDSKTAGCNGGQSCAGLASSQCDAQKCGNAPSGHYYTGKATDGNVDEAQKGDCPFTACTNAEKGFYYDVTCNGGQSCDGVTDTKFCDTLKCGNANTGSFYTGPSSDGFVTAPGDCPTVHCSNAAPGYYYDTTCNGGQSCDGVTDTKFCDTLKCNNAPAGNYYGGPATDGYVVAPGDCPVLMCNNAAPGEYYKNSITAGCDGGKPCAGLVSSKCDTLKCGNHAPGYFYTGPASNGFVDETSKGDCPTAPCSNAKPGEYYKGTCKGGTTSASCDGNTDTNMCDVIKCNNADSGSYYSGPASDGFVVVPGDCPYQACDNAEPGFYYETTCDGGKSCKGVVESTCDTTPCKNMRQGNFYNGPATPGMVEAPGDCPNEPCNNAPAGFYYDVTCNSGESCDGVAESKCDLFPCNNAPVASYYTGPASIGNIQAPGNCPNTLCTNAESGYYYNTTCKNNAYGNGGPGSDCRGVAENICDTIPCENAPDGFYYTSPGQPGNVSSPGACRVATCDHAVDGYFYVAGCDGKPFCHAVLGSTCNVEQCNNAVDGHYYTSANDPKDTYSMTTCWGDAAPKAPLCDGAVESVCETKLCSNAPPGYVYTSGDTTCTIFDAVQVDAEPVVTQSCAGVVMSACGEKGIRPSEDPSVPGWVWKSDCTSEVNDGQLKTLPGVCDVVTCENAAPGYIYSDKGTCTHPVGQSDSFTVKHGWEGKGWEFEMGKTAEEPVLQMESSDGGENLLIASITSTDHSICAWDNVFEPTSVAGKVCMQYTPSNEPVPLEYGLFSAQGGNETLCLAYGAKSGYDVEWVDHTCATATQFIDTMGGTKWHSLKTIRPIWEANCCKKQILRSSQNYHSGTSGLMLSQKPGTPSSTETVHLAQVLGLVSGDNIKASLWVRSTDLDLENAVELDNNLKENLYVLFDPSKGLSGGELQSNVGGTTISLKAMGGATIESYENNMVLGGLTGPKWDNGVPAIYCKDAEPYASQYGGRCVGPYYELSPPFQGGKDAWTVALWFRYKPQSANQAQPDDPIPLLGNNQNTPFLGMRMTTGAWLHLRQFNGGSEILSWDSPEGANYADGQWHHVVLVSDYDELDLELFLDGVSLGRQDHSSDEGHTHGNGNLRSVGRDWGSYMQGNFGPIMIWKEKSLGRQEIQRLYSHGFRDEKLKIKIIHEDKTVASSSSEYKENGFWEQLTVEYNMPGSKGSVVALSLEVPMELSTSATVSFVDDFEVQVPKTVSVRTPKGLFKAEKIVGHKDTGSFVGGQIGISGLSCDGVLTHTCDTRKCQNADAGEYYTSTCNINGIPGQDCHGVTTSVCDTVECDNAAPGYYYREPDTCTINGVPGQLCPRSTYVGSHCEGDDCLSSVDCREGQHVIACNYQGLEPGHHVDGVYIQNAISVPGSDKQVFTRCTSHGASHSIFGRPKATCAPITGNEDHLLIDTSANNKDPKLTSHPAFDTMQLKDENDIWVSCPAGYVILQCSCLSYWGNGAGPEGGGSGCGKDVVIPSNATTCEFTSNVLGARLQLLCAKGLPPPAVELCQDRECLNYRDPGTCAIADSEGTILAGHLTGEGFLGGIKATTGHSCDGVLEPHCDVRKCENAWDGWYYTGPGAPGDAGWMPGRKDHDLVYNKNYRNHLGGRPGSCPTAPCNNSVDGHFYSMGCNGNDNCDAVITSSCNTEVCHNAPDGFYYTSKNDPISEFPFSTCDGQSPTLAQPRSGYNSPNFPSCDGVAISQCDVTECKNAPSGYFYTSKAQDGNEATTCTVFDPDTGVKTEGVSCDGVVQSACGEDGISVCEDDNDQYPGWNVCSFCDKEISGTVPGVCDVEICSNAAPGYYYKDTKTCSRVATVDTNAQRMLHINNMGPNRDMSQDATSGSYRVKYGWEGYGWRYNIIRNLENMDGGPTGKPTPTLGSTNLDDITTLLVQDNTHSGKNSLQVTETADSGGDPDVFLTHVTGLEQGDRVIFSIWIHAGPGAASARIVGHYGVGDAATENANLEELENSIVEMSQKDLHSQNYWKLIKGSWVVGTPQDTSNGISLVISTRIYRTDSVPGIDDTILVDDMEIGVPITATVRTPGGIFKAEKVEGQKLPPNGLGGEVAVSGLDCDAILTSSCDTTKCQNADAGEYYAETCTVLGKPGQSCDGVTTSTCDTKKCNNAAPGYFYAEPDTCTLDGVPGQVCMRSKYVGGVCAGNNCESTVSCKDTQFAIGCDYRAIDGSDVKGARFSGKQDGIYTSCTVKNLGNALAGHSAAPVVTCAVKNADPSQPTEDHTLVTAPAIGLSTGLLTAECPQPYVAISCTCMSDGNACENVVSFSPKDATVCERTIPTSENPDVQGASISALCGLSRAPAEVELCEDRECLNFRDRGTCAVEDESGSFVEGHNTGSGDGFLGGKKVLTGQSCDAELMPHCDVRKCQNAWDGWYYIGPGEDGHTGHSPGPTFFGLTWDPEKGTNQNWQDHFGGRPGSCPTAPCSNAKDGHFYDMGCDGEEVCDAVLTSTCNTQVCTNAPDGYYYTSKNDPVSQYEWTTCNSGTPGTMTMFGVPESKYSKDADIDWLYESPNWPSCDGVAVSMCDTQQCHNAPSGYYYSSKAQDGRSATTCTTLDPLTGKLTTGASCDGVVQSACAEHGIAPCLGSDTHFPGWEICGTCEAEEEGTVPGVCEVLACTNAAPGYYYKDTKTCTKVPELPLHFWEFTDSGIVPDDSKPKSFTVKYGWEGAGWQYDLNSLRLLDNRDVSPANGPSLGTNYEDNIVLAVVDDSHGSNICCCRWVDNTQGNQPIYSWQWNGQGSVPQMTWPVSQFETLQFNSVSKACAGESAVAGICVSDSTPCTMRNPRPDAYARTHSGSNSLKISEPTDSSANPDVYLAHITGLKSGDVVSASAWIHSGPGDMKARLWGLYAAGQKVQENANLAGQIGLASAGGQGSFVDSGFWERVMLDWTIDDSKGTALVIAARVYRKNDGVSGIDDTVYVDDLKLVVPETAAVRTPEGIFKLQNITGHKPFPDGLGGIMGVTGLDCDGEVKPSCDTTKCQNAKAGEYYASTCTVDGKSGEPCDGVTTSVCDTKKCDNAAPGYFYQEPDTCTIDGVSGRLCPRSVYQGSHCHGDSCRSSVSCRPGQMAIRCEHSADATEVQGLNFENLVNGAYTRCTLIRFGKGTSKDYVPIITCAPTTGNEEYIKVRFPDLVQSAVSGKTTSNYTTGPVVVSCPDGFVVQQCVCHSPWGLCEENFFDPAPGGTKCKTTIRDSTNSWQKGGFITALCTTTLPVDIELCEDRECLNYRDRGTCAVADENGAIIEGHRAGHGFLGGVKAISGQSCDGELEPHCDVQKCQNAWDGWYYTGPGAPGDSGWMPGEKEQDIANNLHECSGIHGGNGTYQTDCNHWSQGNYRNHLGGRPGSCPTAPCNNALDGFFYAQGCDGQDNCDAVLTSTCNTQECHNAPDGYYYTSKNNPKGEFGDRTTCNSGTAGTLGLKYLNTVGQTCDGVAISMCDTVECNNAPSGYFYSSRAQEGRDSSTCIIASADNKLSEESCDGMVQSACGAEGIAPCSGSDTHFPGWEYCATCQDEVPGTNAGVCSIETCSNAAPGYYYKDTKTCAKAPRDYCVDMLPPIWSPYQGSCSKAFRDKKFFDVSYGWEGFGWKYNIIQPSLILGNTHPDFVDLELSSDMVHSGENSLQISEPLNSGEDPIVYLAFVGGLADGDVIFPSLWLHPGAGNGQGRLHCIYGNIGAPPQSQSFHDLKAFTSQTASSDFWEYLKGRCTFVADTGHSGFWIGVRIIRSGEDNTIYVDDLEVVVPEQATVVTVEGSFEATLLEGHLDFPQGPGGKPYVAGSSCDAHLESSCDTAMCQNAPAGFYYSGQDGETTCTVTKDGQISTVDNHLLGQSCDGVTTSTCEVIACDNAAPGYYYTEPGTCTINGVSGQPCPDDTSSFCVSRECNNFVDRGTCAIPKQGAPPIEGHLAGADMLGSIEAEPGHSCDGNLLPTCDVAYCTNAPAGNYYTGPAQEGVTTTTGVGGTCPYAACPIDCPVGQWREGCDQGTDSGTCFPCTVPPEGHYWTDDGDFTNNCPTEECFTGCPAGQWNKGCNGEAHEGECFPCSAPPSGYYWSGDGDYTDSCPVEPCPIDCPIGQWRSGCDQTASTGQCTDCSLPPEGYYFTGDGDFTNSCPIAKCLDDCPTGFYRQGCSQSTDDGECVPCTGLKPGHYWLDNADISHLDTCPQAKCEDDCPLGQYRANCDGETGPGECVDCTGLEEGFYWTGNGVTAYTDSCPKAKCADDCEFGFYRAKCDREDRPGVCLSCGSLPDGHYWTGNGYPSDDNPDYSLPTSRDYSDSCPHKKCDVGCDVGQYRQGCEGGTTAGQCIDCSSPPPGSFFTTNGGLTDSCQVETCASSCAIGYFAVGCGDKLGLSETSTPFSTTSFTTSTSTTSTTSTDNSTSILSTMDEGSCIPCTPPPANHRFVSNGGLYDACLVEPCNIDCPIGYYNTGCDGGNNKGECVACDLPPVGHFHSGDGDLANACPVEACPDDCPIAYWRSGCSQTLSAGTCIECSDLELSDCMSNGVSSAFAYPATSTPAEIALLACESHYGKGNCVEGSCGLFKYMYEKSSKSCSCSKENGGIEWIFARTSGDTKHEYVGADYGDDDVGGDTILPTDSMFVRRKVGGCKKDETTTGQASSKTWELLLSNFHLAKESPVSSTCTGFYFTGAGFVEDNCAFEMCNIDCGVGNFLEGCGDTSPGTCKACSGLKQNHYWIGDGNLADACPQAECDPGVCKNGEYLEGCSGSSPGTCVACVDPPLNFMFNGAGGVGDPTSCPTKKCTSDCGAGYRLVGQCSAFEDMTCEPCSESCPFGMEIETTCIGTGTEDITCKHTDNIFNGLDGSISVFNIATNKWIEHDLSGTYNAITGGAGNTASVESSYSAIVNGISSEVRGSHQVAIGKSVLLDNSAAYSASVGGQETRIRAPYSVVIGGYKQTVPSLYVDLLCNGNDECIPKGIMSKVPAGAYLSALNFQCIGSQRAKSCTSLTDGPYGVAVGRNIRLDYISDYSVAIGGYRNTVKNDYGVVAGGVRTRSISNWGTAVGGKNAMVSSRFGTVIGGWGNKVDSGSKYSMSLGRKAFSSRGKQTQVMDHQLTLAFSMSGKKCIRSKTVSLNEFQPNTVKICANYLFIGGVDILNLMRQDGIGVVGGGRRLAASEFDEYDSDRMLEITRVTQQMENEIQLKRSLLTQLQQDVEHLTQILRQEQV
jgi:hypothetical protein